MTPSSGQNAQADRPHTGRRRNERVREAILAAAMDLLARSDGTQVTVDTIAGAAGVGKQTIYRWWPSKGAVFLDALGERAATVAPKVDTGALAGDLEAFVTATFTGAAAPETAPVLRSLAREAAHDRHLAGMMSEFTAARRAELRDILERAGRRGELADDADLDLMVDQVYGVLWYRLILDHAPLTADVAARLARTLVAASAAR
ncbi:TetR/AcrR family transcriptional regulator [Streptodolium elevatio]